MSEPTGGRQRRAIEGLAAALQEWEDRRPPRQAGRHSAQAERHPAHDLDAVRREAGAAPARRRLTVKASSAPRTAPT